MARIGVFVCHCGENIGRTVDASAVAEALRSHPGVAHAEDYRYMCSDPGQTLVREAIAANRLTGVVVAACSPHMHERTFRKVASAAGLNPFLCEMANIREQCSWIHDDREQATRKATAITRTLVEKVKANAPLDTIRIPIERRALVIGGGIAGIQAALDLADGGAEVVLVEKESSIGGHMSQLSETFPTLDCSQCILTPRMVEVAQHPRIRLYAYSEVEEVSGYIGNFEVKVRRKARSSTRRCATGAAPARRRARTARCRANSSAAWGNGPRSRCRSRRRSRTCRCSTARGAHGSWHCARGSRRRSAGSVPRPARAARSTSARKTGS